MNYHLIICEKQKELTKAVKEAFGIGFQKGNLAKYKIDFYMYNGSFNAEIKDSTKGESIIDLGFIELYPGRIWALDIKGTIKELDENIKKIKEFTITLKKLK